MNKKASMELSVNSIVILVIAVVMMGLILGFIRTKFAEVGGGFTVDEQEPLEANPSNPITLSRENVVLSGVKKAGLNVNYYPSQDVAAVTPLFECNTAGVKLVGQYFQKQVYINNMTSFTGNVKLTTTAQKNTYLCKICFLNNYRDVDTTETCSEAVDQTHKIIAEKEFRIIVQ